MENEITVIQLKLQLKQWEIDFMKQNGRKPSKSDIKDNANARRMYIEYARLKKNSKQAGDIDPGQENEERKSSAVWGNNLLKKHSSKSDIDNQLSSEEKVTCGSVSCSTPSQLYRDNIRKNMAHSQLRSLPTNLNKTRSRVNTKQESHANSSMALEPKCFMQKSKITETVKQIDALDCVKECSRVKTEVKMTPVRKIFCKSTPPEKRKLINHSVDILWLNENADDLSDLVNLENQVKRETEFNQSSQKITINAQSVQMPKVTQIDSNTEKAVLRDPVVGRKEKASIAIDNFKQESQEETDLIPRSQVYVPDTDELAKAQGDDSKIKQRKSSSTTKLPASTEGSGQTLVSTNFIRVNMQQKTYCKRGKGKYLRKQIYREKLARKGFSFRSGWKGRSGGAGRSGFRDKSEDKCFKCGEHGHWASKCKSKGSFSPKSASNKEEDPGPVDSLADILENTHHLNHFGSSGFGETQLTVSHAEPVFTPSTYDEVEVETVLKKFGFKNFRQGQEKAIKRILLGKPTLLVLSTGSGKSLCYQLPAYMFATKRNSITLVISPLVSLMDDQVHGLPKFLKASRLHSGMAKEQRDKVLLEIETGKVDILLVSPEALTAWSGMSPRTSPLSKLPPISFVCVDECHCLSEWSHSFRPSYLRVCQVLKEQLGVKCLVGLTATATVSTCLAVAKQLGISDPDEGMVMNMSLPSNLVLTVSRDKYKDEALEQLLNGARFNKLDSVIVYCTRREEAARLAAFLRTRLQGEVVNNDQTIPEIEVSAIDPTTKKRKRTTNGKPRKRRAITWTADCYHAGMSAAERRRVQNRFMSGKLRIVVATVAFGMGIDKQDVRAVIHYNMPRSFERYVQEVGRAGRDRLPAHCHLLLDSDGGDLFELGRHTYGKSVDRYMVKQLVKKIFLPCQCDEKEIDCTGHFAALPIDPSVEEFDLAREGIETLLCYLEMESLVKVFLPTETVCHLYCYEGPSQMMKVVRKFPPVAHALLMQGKTEKCRNEVEFCLVKIANKVGTDVFSLKRSLRNLMWDTTLATGGKGDLGKSGVTVQFKETSFLLRTKRSFSFELLDLVTDNLHKRVVAQEHKEIAQLNTCFSTMQEFSYPNVGCCMDDADLSRSKKLKSVIDSYFQEEDNVKNAEEIPLSTDVEPDLSSTIRKFLNVHGADLGSKLTGRAIARIFHGIDSPRYPAKTWGAARRFWRCKINVDFNSIIKSATAELVKFR
ncbi:ATP-dependent DNA helicase Q4-like [Clavelina lepadiformis]|uniref:ATP-dependent DNA helicase Q4-like n=1 Tax=Clavelina lepadiformis TaxID=159417 RepID=UPI0040437F93